MLDRPRLVRYRSVNAARGQTWRIFARRLKSGLYETNVCDASQRLR